MQLILSYFIIKGYVYNSWDHVHLKWVDEQPHGALVIFQDESLKKEVEKFPKDDIKVIETSRKNEFVFKVHLKKPSPKTKKSIYYFKVFRFFFSFNKSILPFIVQKGDQRKI